MNKNKFYTGSVLILFCISCFISGCKKDKEDTAYQGVGKLVAERHRTRMAQSAEKRGQTNRKQASNKYTPELDDQSSSEKTIFEQKVKIVSSSSGKTLARATAFLDRRGKIINIKIEQE